MCTTLQTPVTVPLGAGMRSNSTFLNLTDPTLAGANATGNTPTQVRLVPCCTAAYFVYQHAVCTRACNMPADTCAHVHMYMG